MVLGLNWVDLVIIGVLILFALESLGRPLILELVDFLSFLLAGFLSFSYYNLPAKFFQNQFQIPHGLTLVLGFMAVWFLSETIFCVFIRLFLPRILRIRVSGSRILSLVPATLRGLVFIAIILVMVATFPIQPVIKRGVLDSKIGSVILRNAYTLEQPVKQVLITLVNTERTERGLKALVFDGRLRAIAKDHSTDMFKRGYFSHYSPEGLTVADRALNSGIDFLVIGENLAYALIVESAHQGLMNSEGHRANILSEDYGRIGIGAMDGGVYGRMFTQVFSN